MLLPIKSAEIKILSDVQPRSVNNDFVEQFQGPNIIFCPCCTDGAPLFLKESLCKKRFLSR